MESLEVLVACADTEVSKKISALAAQRGLRVVLAATVQQSRLALAERRVGLVFCEERLVDGDFRDLLLAVSRAAGRIPLVVMARVGEWQEYLRAVSLGAFNFIAPPFHSPELERLFRNALREQAPDAVQVKAPLHKSRGAAAGRGLACAS